MYAFYTENIPKVIKYKSATYPRPVGGAPTTDLYTQPPPTTQVYFLANTYCPNTMGHNISLVVVAVAGGAGACRFPATDVYVHVRDAALYK